MARLTYSQIQQLWIQNGGSKALAPLMAAIALAESGGRTDALNPTAPDYSVGLWQINYYGALREGRTRLFGSPEELIADPARQVKAARSILHGQGLGAWSTYTNGAYRQYLGGASTSALPPNLSTAPAVGAGGGSSVQAAGLQQAGYDAVVDLTPWGIPLNPFKLPGYLAGKLGGALGDGAKGLAGAAGGALWDGLGPVLLATVGVAGGLGLITLGLYVTVRPAVQKATSDVEAAAPLAAA